MLRAKIGPRRVDARRRPESRLVYFSGRTHWRCTGLGCWDYVADRLYVVRRGGGVEATLGVAKQVDLYERPAAVSSSPHSRDATAFAAASRSVAASAGDTPSGTPSVATNVVPMSAS